MILTILLGVALVGLLFIGGIFDPLVVSQGGQNEPGAQVTPPMHIGYPPVQAARKNSTDHQHLDLSLIHI